MFLFLCMYNYICRYYCFRTYMCAHVFRWYHLTLCDHMLSGKHVSSFRDTDIQPLGQSFRQRTRALPDHECTKENYPTARTSKASFSSFPPRFQIVLQQASAVRSLFNIQGQNYLAMPCTWPRYTSSCGSQQHRHAVSFLHGGIALSGLLFLFQTL